MKKLTLITFLFACLFISCKKSYTCTCTGFYIPEHDPHGGVTPDQISVNEVTAIDNESQGDAETLCNYTIENDLINSLCHPTWGSCGTNINCKLSKN